jgi:hypothetical protein
MNTNQIEQLEQKVFQLLMGNTCEGLIKEEDDKLTELWKSNREIFERAKMSDARIIVDFMLHELGIID